MNIFGYSIKFCLIFYEKFTSKETKIENGFKYTVEEFAKRVEVYGKDEVTKELRRHIVITIWTDRISLWQKIKNKLNTKT